ncbi:MAG: C40 family peptidase, partial [Rubrobacteraceae bacterium]|nr:C40 family peptidase [Rubrobacteraceae bacterium]
EVYAHFGIYLPHSAAAQYSYGTAVSSPSPGDLVFMNFDGGSSITHVGIVVGGGQMIDAPYPGTVVRYDPIYPQYTIGYRHLI